VTNFHDLIYDVDEDENDDNERRSVMNVHDLIYHVDKDDEVDDDKRRRR
jgi:hypothetical protein